MEVLQLDSSHVWKAAPGCRILIIDGGAVRFDFPARWTVISTPRYVCVTDRCPPDHRTMIAISWRRTPLGASGIPLTLLLTEATAAETRPVLERKDPRGFLRPPLEGAWTEMRVLDSERSIEICTRLCLARADSTQALVMFDFRPEDEFTVFPVWNTLLATLSVGDYIEDPATGRKRAQRG
jgi:hypothetical protein